MTEQEIIHALWTCHEAFRRLGFSADDIYVSCNVLDPHTKKMNAGSILRTQGKEFSIYIAPVDDPKAFLMKWVAFAEAMPNRQPDDKELADIWAKSAVRTRGIELIMALEAKGIHCRPTASLLKLFN